MTTWRELFWEDPSERQGSLSLGIWTDEVYIYALFSNFFRHWLIQFINERPRSPSERVGIYVKAEVKLTSLGYHLDSWRILKETRVDHPIDFAQTRVYPESYFVAGSI